MSNHYDYASASRLNRSQLKELFSPGRDSPFKIISDPASPGGLQVVLRRSGKVSRKVSGTQAEGSAHGRAAASTARQDARGFFCNAVAVQLAGNKTLADRVCTEIGFSAEKPINEIDFLQLAHAAYATIEVVRCNQSFTQAYLSDMSKDDLGYKAALESYGKENDAYVPILKALVCREIEGRSHFIQRKTNKLDMSGAVRGAVARYRPIKLGHYVNILQELMYVLDVRVKILKIMHAFGFEWPTQSEADQKKSGADAQAKP